MQGVEEVGNRAVGGVWPQFMQLRESRPLALCGCGIRQYEEAWRAPSSTQVFVALLPVVFSSTVPPASLHLSSSVAVTILPVVVGVWWCCC